MVDLVMTHDYKVIQSVDRVPGPEDNEFWYSDRPCLETFWIIYSLKSNSWRKLDLNLPNHHCRKLNHFAGVYTNGVCHWWARTDDSPNIPAYKNNLIAKLQTSTLEKSCPVAKIQTGPLEKFVFR
jgi:hypothetical protein